MLLLGVALAAALYSSSAARDGRIIPAAAGAAAAMALAGWVALRVVPQIASSVDWRFIRLSNRSRLSREGWIYVAATAVVAFSAVNTSNNLLYMVLSSMLAVFALSGLMSGLNLRMLEVSATTPNRCFAKQPFQMAVSVCNRKRLFPTLSIDLRPLDDSPLQFRRTYLPLIGALWSETRMIEAVAPRRGSCTIEQLRVRSRFPFGFAVKERLLPIRIDCLAYPEILPLDLAGSPWRSRAGAALQLERLEKGRGMDLYSIRDYQSSDSIRIVDWKATAKTSVLKAKEFAREDEQRILLLFDRYGEPDDEELFEQMVSHAASLAVHLDREGIGFEMISDGWTPAESRFEGRLESILNRLALVEMDPEAPRPAPARGEAVVYSLRISTQAGAWAPDAIPWNATSSFHSTRFS